MKIIVDLRVELELNEDEDLNDYENPMHYARESNRDIADIVRSDEFEILQVQVEHERESEALDEKDNANG